MQSNVKLPRNPIDDDELNSRASDVKLNAPDVASDSEKMVETPPIENPKKASGATFQAADEENAQVDPDEIVVELDSNENNNKPVRASQSKKSARISSRSRSRSPTKEPAQ